LFRKKITSSSAVRCGCRQFSKKIGACSPAASSNKTFFNMLDAYPARNDWMLTIAKSNLSLIVDDCFCDKKLCVTCSLFTATSRFPPWILNGFKSSTFLNATIIGKQSTVCSRKSIDGVTRIEESITNINYRSDLDLTVNWLVDPSGSTRDRIILSYLEGQARNNSEVPHRKTR
jgi:hypothetical protein